MAIPGSLFYRSPALQVIYVLNVSYPFRRRGDPPECGVASYELTCTDDKAIIQIDNGTYLVRGINYTDATFSVVDANMLDSSNSTCPLPRWNRIPYKRWYWVVEDSSRNIVQELMPSYSTITAAFVTCSLEVTNNGVYMYMPVACLSTNSSFVYVLTGWSADSIQSLEPSYTAFDIKPHNILLDDNFVPKVADFGLAKLYPRDNSFVPLNALRGTIGYIAPEMISRSFGVISSKSDVYSFGMLLLEMAGGRRNSDMRADNSSQAYYPSWVYDRLIEQQVGAGEISAATVANMHELERKLCIIGLHCIQMKSHDRPTMSEVIEMLEGGVVGLQMPPRPFFCDDESMSAMMDSYQFSSGLTEILEEDE
ncbi:hypothetical protein OsI_28063 [Oryza sativa Indica Group]|uniref:Protein kinase domain-containing protein n=1 Tax=Oryza sativa subsp. indica TaxID=39946 RepID=B8BBE0_ORYSI|nr:hypothetical protein OsI_28063 [Oryza sativa Indica Group]